MRFADIKGNKDVCKVLAGMVDSGRIPHAIMLHEDDGGQGVPIALAFLQHLYCTRRDSYDSCGVCPGCNRVSKMIHPDVHFIFPTAAGHTSEEFLAKWRELVASGTFGEQKFKDSLGMSGKTPMIAVSEAVSLMRILGLSALEGGWRSVFVYLPELMNQEAANKLLKIIEEPPARTQFVMVTHAPEKVLVTIASRCQHIRVMPVDGAEVSSEEDSTYRQLFSNLMEALVSRDLFASLLAADEISSLPDRESAKAFCKFASGQLRAMFLRRQGLGSLAGGVPCQDDLAAKCRPSFPRRASELLSRSQMLIGRNVNMKIVFTDLAAKLYMIV